MDKLKSLGLSDWYKAHLEADKVQKHELARVVAVNKDSYLISKGEGEAFAELSGNLIYSADSSLELPTTGDWVYANFYDEQTSGITPDVTHGVVHSVIHGVIHGIVTRKNALKRKTPGKAVGFQLIAANIELAFILQSVDDNLNLRRLERYLVMVNDSDILPVILLSKCDLVTEEALQQMSASILAIAPRIKIIPFSNQNGDKLDAIKALLTKGHTYCLLGSSGVGKTSLLNRIIGHNQFDTQAVSNKDSKGRHTTTRRHLVTLESGALIVDTPGMRELGQLSVDEGMDTTFSEILALAQGCKFSDCSHGSEAGCAILPALEDGTLSQGRYQNYLKMQHEAAFYDLSYSQKRKKDKTLGKLIKSVQKSNNKNSR